MISRGLLLLIASAFALVVFGQNDYDNGYQQGYDQDYSQDGLYADYARQQQAKEVAANT